MYKNSELELLKNNQKRLASTELDEVIKAIDLYYNDFNNNCARFTTNYITTMTNLFNQFSICNLISTAYGGNLRLMPTASEDIKKIIETTKNYLEKINELQYLSFLSEEKRNVIFVGPNGCGKTTLLRHLIGLTGEQDIAYYQADRLLLIDKSYNPERDDKQFQITLSQTYHSATDVNTSNQGYYINKQLNQIITLFEKKRSSELEHYFDGKLSKESCKTEFILRAWNNLIKDRELYCDGTLKVKTLEGMEYEIKHLSSGEKNIFYFLASIILQDGKKYYFIDEQKIILILLLYHNYGIL